MTLKIEMLRCFCAVAQAGNLADAADRLGRTQSAVSMMLKQFETQLGNPLFEGERKNKLTVLGSKVLQLASAQLKHFDSTVQAIQGLSQAPQGILRLSAVPSVAVLAFPAVVRHFSEQFPSARIELRDADSLQVLEALSEGWADIGIASVSRVLKGVASVPLLSDPFGLVLAKTHPLAQLTGGVSVKDVFREPVLRNVLCDQVRTVDVQEHLKKVSVTVHNTQSLMSMVAEGDWVTILPQSTMRLAPKGVIFRAIKGLPDVRHIHMYVRETNVSQSLVEEAEMVIRSLKWSRPA